MVPVPVYTLQFWSLNMLLLVVTLAATLVFSRQQQSGVLRLFALLVSLLTGTVAAASFWYWPTPWLRWFFELDADMNVPALFSGMQWFGVATVCWLVGGRLQNWMARIYLRLVSLLFVAVSIDDFFALHEFEVVDWRWLYFRFGIVFGLITLAVVWATLRDDLRWYPYPFIIALLGFVMIGISGFLVESPLLRACATAPGDYLCQHFKSLTRIEEIFEMVGANVLLFGLLLYLERLQTSDDDRTLHTRGPRAVVVGSGLYIVGVMVYLLALPPLEVRALTDVTPIPYQGEPIQLRGVYVPGQAYAPGDRVPLVLYWHASGRPSASYHLSVHLVNQDGQSVASTEEYLLGELPNRYWLAGQTVRKFAIVRIPEDVQGPVAYRLGVRVWRGEWAQGWQAGTQGLLAEAPAKIADDMPDVAQVSVLPPANRMPFAVGAGDFVFDGQLALAAYDLPPEATPGEVVPLSFTWAIQQRPPATYSQFLHFFHEEGDATFVADREPFDGRFPTTAWPPDARVTHHFDYMLPAEMPPGTYRVHTGLYNIATGERLPVHNASDQPVPDASIPIAEIRIR